MQSSLWIQHPAVGDTESPRESWQAGLHYPRGQWGKGCQAPAGRSVMIDRAKDSMRSSDHADPYTKAQSGRKGQKTSIPPVGGHTGAASLLAWSKGKTSVPLNKTSSLRPES